MDAKTLDVLVNSTEGFSGAHIYHLVDYSKAIAEDENINIGKALLESLLRMSDQVALVASLSQTQAKELFNESDLRQSADEPITLTEVLQVVNTTRSAKKQSKESKALEKLAAILIVENGGYA